MKITEQPFGILPDGQTAKLYTLENGTVSVSITNYGGIVTRLLTPDSNGHLDDVVLGFDTLEHYLADNPYFGCITGRFANRIKEGKLTIGDNTYQLEKNNGSNHLHGGLRGLDKQLWSATTAETPDSVSLVLRHLSPDGTGNYPGNLDCTVTYSLSRQGNDLTITYRATTDQPTPVNLTHHSYFNLGGHGHGSILDHCLTLDADAVTAIDSESIPTGERMPVAGTPLDFTSPHRIGERIDSPHPQLANGNGYDHNWIINNPTPGEVTLVATVTDPGTGRSMDVLTDQPGIQFYTANFLDGSLTGKSGTAYQRRSGLCLETQNFPDAPNQPTFPNAILNPGETYRHTCIYRFGNI